MNKESVIRRIREIGIVPALRFHTAADVVFAVETVSKSGIPIAEVTMTIPGAVDLIAMLAKHDPQLVVGAGTVLDMETARRCVDAGAHFLTSPGLDVEVVEFALKHNVVVFPGAFTPSEIMTAARAGADFIKVFPCSAVGGASYIKALTGPFPHIPLIAAGGVNQQTAGDFIHAGAVAVGIGRELVPPEAVTRRQVDWIEELARRFTHIVTHARAHSQAG